MFFADPKIQEFSRVAVVSRKVLGEKPFSTFAAATTSSNKSGRWFKEVGGPSSGPKVLVQRFPGTGAHPLMKSRSHPNVRPRIDSSVGEGGCDAWREGPSKKPRDTASCALPSSSHETSVSRSRSRAFPTPVGGKGNLRSKSAFFRPTCKSTRKERDLKIPFSSSFSLLRRDGAGLAPKLRTTPNL
ncbi:hypothetical protein GWK47_028227 [Chionoecetes opilio]|uniref:Uncharacterized protein n=1 Tax=Chionoecetes opilio TaxID=41210 RepID=A0A8J5D2K0_CHIOP|nr:hypothetical protein GWK47_028227 [Chionoecetes opilio]